MYTNFFTADLYLYTGSTFDGSIVIKDVHGEPFMISEGDEITLYIRNADKDSTDKPVQLSLTYEDETMGEYTFKLTPEITADLDGDFYFSVFLRFADGDCYQIVPNIPLHASTPYGALQYYEDKNRIFAQVPRVMAESDYEPALNELEEYISCVESEESKCAVHIRRINNEHIILIGKIDTSKMTPAQLIDLIDRISGYVGADQPYASGFFHGDEIPEQNEYYTAVKEAFGNKFIDVERILKTPVFAKNTETVIGSAAFDILKQRPDQNDILRILHNEYPERILLDERHFNSTGCFAAAKTILKEVHKNG